MSGLKRLIHEIHRRSLWQVLGEPGRSGDNMKLILPSLSVLLVAMPITANAQQANILAGHEFSTPVEMSTVAPLRTLGSEPGRHSLLYTTLGAVAAASFGLAMASSFTGELCVEGEVGCGVLFLGLYGGFITLGASAAAEAADSDPAWLQTALGALVGGAISLMLSEIYEDRFSERDPTPQESLVIVVSVSVPPIVGAVIGNRLGQGRRSASGK